MAHIMQCPNQEAQAIGNQNILELRALLKELEMDPAIMEDLSEGVNTWRQNKQPPQMLTEPVPIIIIYILGQFLPWIHGNYLGNAPS